MQRLIAPLISLSVGVTHRTGHGAIFQTRELCELTRLRHEPWRCTFADIPSAIDAIKVHEARRLPMRCIHCSSRLTGVHLTQLKPLCGRIDDSRDELASAGHTGSSEPLYKCFVRPVCAVCRPLRGHAEQRHPLAIVVPQERSVVQPPTCAPSSKSQGSNQRARTRASECTAGRK